MTPSTLDKLLEEIHYKTWQISVGFSYILLPKALAIYITLHSNTSFIFPDKKKCLQIILSKSLDCLSFENLLLTQITQ